MNAVDGTECGGVLPDIMTDYAQWRQGLIEWNVRAGWSAEPSTVQLFVILSALSSGVQLLAYN